MKRFLRFLERHWLHLPSQGEIYERECDTFTLPHTHTQKHTLTHRNHRAFIVENDDDDDDEAFFIFIIPGIIYSREQ